ncbi:hypothetical protein FRC03_012814 [Tulasnella sp. 419]|nr:hypothetical protein FRC03_012814 [Tulasnella sp. 419]
MSQLVLFVTLHRLPFAMSVGGADGGLSLGIAELDHAREDILKILATIGEKKYPCNWDSVYRKAHVARRRIIEAYDASVEQAAPNIQVQDSEVLQNLVQVIESIRMPEPKSYAAWIMSHERLMSNFRRQRWICRIRAKFHFHRGNAGDQE